MSKLCLPTIDPNRTEFGFCRTVCRCDDCVRNCRRLPGYLIPADLARISQTIGPTEEMSAWAQKYLLASPGALVARLGNLFRVPTLVPGRRADGACLLLSLDDRCAIHSAAPFGCAFFDSSMTNEEANNRSGKGLQTIFEAWLHGELYGQIWTMLWDMGLRAPPAEISRRQKPPLSGPSP